MIPQLESAEALKVIASIVGGMKGLHVLFKESGNDIAYSSLSRYVAGGVKFESKVFSNLFKTIKEGKSFTAREAMRNLEDAYIVLNELVGQGLITPRKIGEAGELDKDWEKKQTLTKEEIKDLEAEFGTKLSSEQKEILQGKRRKVSDAKPRSSRSIDDLFDDEEENVTTVPIIKEEPELKEEEKPKGFLEDFLNDDSEEKLPPRNGLTDPFEVGLRQTEDVFTKEDHRF